MPNSEKSSKLERLKQSKNISGFAELLGLNAQGLSFILYKIEDQKKYRTFEIPKKSGGTRKIDAPEARVKLVQNRLSDLLTACVNEIKGTHKLFWKSSHGFQKHKTIVSNAHIHHNRRFVFNIDLEDFFGSINFGRVRGFFISDRQFTLEKTIATLIAQVACHNNALPQGSPCSPIISNLIGNILDLRLIGLAKATHCTYTRYADDITFSTNENTFPKEIALLDDSGSWIAGDTLRSDIEKSGFKINNRKTRMAFKESRQEVTGLTVNKKVNINKQYYRLARSMCNSLFSDGSYFCKKNETNLLTDLNILEGILSHIYFVKARKDRSIKINKMALASSEFAISKSTLELYRKFLFYKLFLNAERPLIVTEGKTDIQYLKCAIRSRANVFPSLGKNENGIFHRKIAFLEPSHTTHEVLNLGQGASGQASLVAIYTKTLKNYRHKLMEHPIIILCDNDNGPKTVFKNAKDKVEPKQDISIKTIEPFYFLGDNLYLVKIPEGSPAISRDMEDLIPLEWHKKIINGKHFNKNKENEDETSYGKAIFADQVVRLNSSEIDFSAFDHLLSRVSLCIEHYKTHKASLTTKTATKSAAKKSKKAVPEAIS